MGGPRQLNPPLPLTTPRGEGWAHLVTWNSIEHSLYWTVFLDSGEVWTFRNEDVRACKNVTAERPAPAKPKRKGERQRAERRELPSAIGFQISVDADEA